MLGGISVVACDTAGRRCSG